MVVWLARSTPFLTVTDQHLVTPPPKLVDQWLEGADSNDENVSEGLALRAAQWGADQNFEAIIRRLVSGPYGASVATSDLIADLRAAFNKPFNKPAPQSTRLHSYKIGTGAIDLASVNPNDFVPVSPSQHAPPSPATAPSKLPPNSNLTPSLTVTDSNSITPPLEMVEQWYTGAKNQGRPYFDYIATQAAQWGYAQRGAINEVELQKARDEELEECRKAIVDQIITVDNIGLSGPTGVAHRETHSSWPAFAQMVSCQLHAARRPKPKSQAEKAIQALKALEQTAILLMPVTGRKKVERLGVIRAALEHLRELEEGNA